MDEQFEEWWRQYWHQAGSLPGILEAAFKELAREAWEAGRRADSADGDAT